MDIVQRFLNYTKINTTTNRAAGAAGIMPSNPKELELTGLIKSELEALGIQNISLSERSILIAKIPSNLDAPYEEATAFLKLLANPHRLAVLCKLHERPYNVTELAESSGLPQAAMSSQLALLREAGLVSFEVNHRERQYYIADPRVTEMIQLLYSFFCADKP